MQIVNEKPPIWAEVIDMIGATPRGAIFCWGDKIYNPDGIIVRDYLIAHEVVHEDQQRATGSPEAWWVRYLDDPWFRVQEEVEAYGAQYRFMCKRAKDRNMQTRILTDLARSLSGPLYGNAITHQKAMEWIKAGKCL